jgi:hypothetical protein
MEEIDLFLPKNQVEVIDKAHKVVPLIRAKFDYYFPTNVVLFHHNKDKAYYKYFKPPELTNHERYFVAIGRALHNKTVIDNWKRDVSIRTEILNDFFPMCLSQMIDGYNYPLSVVIDVKFELDHIYELGGNFTFWVRDNFTPMTGRNEYKFEPENYSVSIPSELELLEVSPVYDEEFVQVKYKQGKLGEPFCWGEYGDGDGHYLHTFYLTIDFDELNKVFGNCEFNYEGRMCYYFMDNNKKVYMICLGNELVHIYGREGINNFVQYLLSHFNGRVVGFWYDDFYVDNKRHYFGDTWFP